MKAVVDYSVDYYKTEMGAGGYVKEFATINEAAQSNCCFSFCNKSKIVEAVKAGKLVAVDGLGVINEDDLDKIEEL